VHAELAFDAAVSDADKEQPWFHTDMTREEAADGLYVARRFGHPCTIIDSFELSWVRVLLLGMHLDGFKPVTSRHGMHACGLILP
jgi:hypothetical protein